MSDFGTAVYKLIQGDDKQDFTFKISQASNELGMNPFELTIFLHYFSGLNATKGLIPFRNDVQKVTGKTLPELKAMTRTVQMDYVIKYILNRLSVYGATGTFVDTYLLIAYPEALTVTGDCAALPFTATDISSFSSFQTPAGTITRSSIWQNFYNTYSGIGIDITELQAKPVCTADEIAAANTAAANNTPASDTNFQKIQNNIDSVEAESTNKSWGSRTNAIEESDFIGLKQFLLYLTTRYYPSNLIPFVELIPLFSIDSSQKNTSVKTNLNTTQTQQQPDAFATVNKVGSSTFSSSTAQQQNLTQNFENSNTLVDEARFKRTSEQLKTLQRGGGTDLLSLDPFFETTDSFNVPNAEGKAIMDKRGYGYKIFGVIDLNPPIQGSSTSKAGQIGLRSIEIEAGSQVHNGMASIIIKMLDVQGNKLLDVNSPWSLILNGRVGGAVNDFLFRFGWQIRVPNPNTKDDDQQKRYWNHPGWKLFSSLNSKNSGDDALEVKKYLQNIASHNDGYITLTQSNTLNSMNTPGYRRDQQTGEFIVDRKINFLDYMSIVLINPELNVNPQDGSIEATLYFRSTPAVANCLALLSGANLPLNKNGQPIFQTKALVQKTNNPTLAALMQAFVNDNKAYIYNSPSLSTINDNKKDSIFYADKDINQWLTVIGGAGSKGSFDVDPSSINLVISPKAKDDINRADTQDTRQLIEWLNGVLNENNLALLQSGTNDGATEGLTGGFIIASTKTSQSNPNTQNGGNLALKDPSFGDFLNYSSPNSSDQNFIGNRLFVQDDVFSFRFQGSLVEELQIEKLEQPTEQTIKANQSLANSQGEGESPTDIKPNTFDINGNQTNANASSDPQKNVTLESKKRQLNILYSSMLGLKVRAICHPWLKMGRNCYVKGMGFWDGKYIVTKIKHILSEDNKFITEINASRIINTDNDNATDLNNSNASERAMNNPAAQKATAVSNTNQNTTTKNYAVNKSPYTATGAQQASQDTSDGPDTPLRPELESFVSQLHYAYQSKFRSFLRDFEAQGNYLIIITSGYRSWAQQAVLKAQDPKHNATPGYSTHNYGLAIDLNLTDLNGNIVALKNSPDSVWMNTGILSFAQQRGFTWGGTSFGEYHDRVHFGLDGMFNKNTLYSMSLQQFGITTVNSTTVATIQGNKLNLGGSTVAFNDTPSNVISSLSS